MVFQFISYIEENFYMDNLIRCDIIMTNWCCMCMLNGVGFGGWGVCSASFISTFFGLGEVC